MSHCRQAMWGSEGTTGHRLTIHAPLTPANTTSNTLITCSNMHCVDTHTHTLYHQEMWSGQGTT